MLSENLSNGILNVTGIEKQRMKHSRLLDTESQEEL